MIKDSLPVDNDCLALGFQMSVQLGVMCSFSGHMASFFLILTFFSALITAKNRDEEGAGEVGEVDGAGDRGATREGSQPDKRHPESKQPEQQNNRCSLFHRFVQQN